VTTDQNHLDAETVAAWIDGGLDATSLAAAEAHASNCERCQALLATVARTLPSEIAPGFIAPAFRRGIRWRWWLAPIAATAAAVMLWMVVPQEPTRPPASQAPAGDMAQRSAETATPSPATEPPPAVAQAPRPAPAEPTADARFSEPRPKVARADAEAKAKVADTQANKAAAPLRDQQADRVANRQEKLEENRVRAAPAPAAPAAAPAEGARLGATQLRKQVAPLEFVSPDPNRRWRAITAGTIEFSQDGGRTWIPVRLNAGEDVTGGASPAPLVCWIVGRAGLVLLATDGTNFTRLPFPERVDLISITAADAQRATVTTADGRTFQTSDNGRNWR
jgi:hypothetical protein